VLQRDLTRIDNGTMEGDLYRKSLVDTRLEG
jgi:hypothetical protein